MPTPVRTLGDLAFWLAAALGAALFGLFLLASAGVVPVEDAERAETVAARRAPVVPIPAREPETTRATTSEAPRAAPPEVTVTVTATRGASWIAARIGSESGRLLEERLLPQGETARLTGSRVWLLVGAAANVDVQVDGKPRSLAPGTVETVFAPPAG